MRAQVFGEKIHPCRARLLPGLALIIPRPFPASSHSRSASSSSSERLWGWRASAWRCGGSIYPPTTGSCSSVVRWPLCVLLCSYWVPDGSSVCLYLIDISLIWGCCRVQVLYYTVLTVRERGHKAVYTPVERPLHFAQTATIMEVRFPSVCSVTVNT